MKDRVTRLRIIYSFILHEGNCDIIKFLTIYDLVRCISQDLVSRICKGICPTLCTTTTWCVSGQRHFHILKCLFALQSWWKGFQISVLYCRFNPVSLLSADFIKGWHICQLEVMECRKIPWPTIVVQDEYCIEDCGWPFQDYAYECKINLLTGRTHQVC
jgi:hypothetical protein